MYFKKMHCIAVWLTILSSSTVAYAQTDTVPAKKTIIGTVNELERYYDDKIKEARRAIEIERLAALEEYLGTAPPSERLDVLLNTINAAMYLERYDKVISLSESIISNYPKYSNVWQVYGLRFEALMNNGRLDQVRREWEKAGTNVDMQNWQGVFQTAMMIADRYTEAYKVDEVKAIYAKLKAKLPFVNDLNTVLNMKTDRLFWVGRTPPAIEGRDLSGKAIDLEEYRGKVVLLEFWATWCVPCIAQLPHMKRLYDEYRHQGYEIIGISLDENAETVKTFVDKHQIPWRQLSDQSAYRGVNARKYNVSAIPASFLIGRDGKIVYADEPIGGFEPVIRRLLAKPVPAK